MQMRIYFGSIITYCGLRLKDFSNQRAFECYGVTILCSIIFSTCASNWRGIGVCLPPMLYSKMFAERTASRNVLVLFYFILCSIQILVGVATLLY